MPRFRPKDEQELARLISWAAGDGEALEVVAAGTKRGLGRPVEAPHVLDVTAFTGIEAYEPEELVLTAKPGTPLVEIESTLQRADQMLAFEPGDWGPIFGGEAGRQTLGGMLACNLAGPRRIKQGAARDHLLGFRAVSGRGEAFKAGGRVVKNVTGYDLSKLMAGSYGTLAVLTEVTVKVLPRPEATATLVLPGLDDARAVAAMTHALNSPHEVSGAAHIPAAVAADVMSGTSRSATLIRVEGPGPSVEARAVALRQELGDFGTVELLREGAATAPWRALADIRPFAAERDRTIWRVSVAPQSGPAVAAAITSALDARITFDWGGGLLWCAVVGDAADGGAEIVRTAAKTAGGHATLVRATVELRSHIAVFEPQPAPLAALSRRIKESFDPKRILNPGRMYRDV
ncbi:MAG: glycolate oxidase subunit GlcE [Stellaceae bacterium]